MIENLSNVKFTLSRRRTEKMHLQKEVLGGVAEFLLGHELKLCVLRVGQSHLQRLQLQRESRTALLKLGGFRVLENVAMMPKEHKVALIVKGHHSASVKIRFLLDKRYTNELLEPQRCIEITRQT
jgi:hypothetical protein